VADWIEDCDPELIAHRLEGIKTKTPDGKASFSGIEFMEYIAILSSMIRFNRNIPESEATKIIKLACFAAAPLGKISKASLLLQAKILENNYLEAPKKKYRLVTSLSADIGDRIGRFRFDDVQVCFGWSPNNAFLQHKKRVNEAKCTLQSPPPENHYCPVSAIVYARNESEAAQLALDKIDLVRSIWNLWKNRSIMTRMSSGRREPFNSFILGPIHTLHQMNGDVVSDNWWYETSYQGAVAVCSDANNNFASIINFTKKARTRITNIAYRDTIISALIQYSKALDCRDWNHSFLQLWSVIEQLTGTTPSESHKITVRRAAFLLRDSNYEAQVLNHLRANRNSSIHAGIEKQNPEPILHQARFFVENLLHFHLSRGAQFRTMKEVSTLLDQSTDISRVDEQIGVLKNARTYLSTKIIMP
jgi:hypothetical protein